MADGGPQQTMKPVLIAGAGVSGLLLAQYLRKTGVPFQIFERDGDLTTRGLGWGLTLHWSLPALQSLLPQDLFLRLPETYVDRAAVEQGQSSLFPFFDLSTGELKASTPPAKQSERIRVARDRLRRLLATGLDIQARHDLWFAEIHGLSVVADADSGPFALSSGVRQSEALILPKMDLLQSGLMTVLLPKGVCLRLVTAAALASEPPYSPTNQSTKFPSA
jgi:hypothetical protein